MVEAKAKAKAEVAVAVAEVAVMGDLRRRWARRHCHRLHMRAVQMYRPPGLSIASGADAPRRGNRGSGGV